MAGKNIQVFLFLGLALLACNSHNGHTQNESSQKLKGKVPLSIQIITTQFCSQYDISSFLKNDVEDSTGIDGQYDSNLRYRIQIYFTSVTRDSKNNTIYNVTGSSRLNKKVTHFKGIITIDTVRLFDRNYWFSGPDSSLYSGAPDSIVKRHEEFRSHQFEERYILVKSTFSFFEDSLKQNNGKFTGTLYFGLALDSDSNLIEGISRYEGITAQNSIYRGVYQKYKSKKSTFVYWTPYYNPYFHINGALDWLPNYEEYSKRGWAVDSNDNFIDDPKLWWKK